jgi:hypothetical protein
MLAIIALGLSVPLKQICLVLRLSMLGNCFHTLQIAPPSRAWIQAANATANKAAYAARAIFDPEDAAHKQKAKSLR